MMHHLLAVALAGLAASCASGPIAREKTDVRARPVAAAKSGRRETIRAVLLKNVRVVVASGGEAVRSASGVVLGTSATPSGAVSYVMTNAHVVQPRSGEIPEYRVLLDLPVGERQEFGASVVAQGRVPEEDLALLAVPGIRLEAARLASDEDLSVGDEVVVVASPYGRSLSVSGGMVSQVDFDHSKPPLPSMIKTDAPIGYGASGGGLFSVEDGRLLGIVEGYRTAKVSIPVAQETYSFDVPMPGETFVAPAAKIRRFLQANGLNGLLEAGQNRKATPERPDTVAAS
jgi:serine protease Do